MIYESTNLGYNVYLSAYPSSTRWTEPKLVLNVFKPWIKNMGAYHSKDTLHEMKIPKMQNDFTKLCRVVPKCLISFDCCTTIICLYFMLLFCHLLWSYENFRNHQQLFLYAADDFKSSPLIIFLKCLKSQFRKSWLPLIFSCAQVQNLLFS